MEEGRQYPALAQQRLEARKVALLGLRHAADLVGATAPPEHVELALIDARRPVFAGVVDAQHPRDLLGRVAVSGKALRPAFAHAMPRRIPAPRCGRRNRLKAARQPAVIASEARRFQPASETPHSDHAGSSQLTGIRPRIRAFKASTVSAAVALPVQASGPANQ